MRKNLVCKTIQFLAQKITTICFWLLLNAAKTTENFCVSTDEQILLWTGSNGFEKLHRKANETEFSAYNWIEDVYGQYLAYSPRDGGTIFAMSDTKLVTFSNVTSRNKALWQPDRAINLPNPICDFQFGALMLF